MATRILVESEQVPLWSFPQVLSGSTDNAVWISLAIKGTDRDLYFCSVKNVKAESGNGKSSLISSKRTVPWSAASKKSRFSAGERHRCKGVGRIAESSGSSSEIALQLIFYKRLLDKEPLFWIYSAKLFPTPLSP